MNDCLDYDTAKQAKKQGEIPGQIDELEKAFHFINEELGKLTSALAPIMSPERPEVKEVETTIALLFCDVAARVHSSVIVANRICRRLMDLQNRLEL